MLDAKSLSQLSSLATAVAIHERQMSLLQFKLAKNDSKHNKQSYAEPCTKTNNNNKKDSERFCKSLNQ